MMKKNRLKEADFFEENRFDPIDAAIGEHQVSPPAAKRKAGFYLPAPLIERFDRKFYELKLAGVSVTNKSALLELALGFALDDLDRETESYLLERLKQIPPVT